MVKSTESNKVKDILQKVEEYVRKKVNEVSLDLAFTMERIIKKEVS